MKFDGRKLSNALRKNGVEVVHTYWSNGVRQSSDWEKGVEKCRKFEDEHKREPKSIFIVKYVYEGSRVMAHLNHSNFTVEELSKLIEDLYSTYKFAFRWDFNKYHTIAVYQITEN